MALKMEATQYGLFSSQVKASSYRSPQRVAHHRKPNTITQGRQRVHRAMRRLTAAQEDRFSRVRCSGRNFLNVAGTSRRRPGHVGSCRRAVWCRAAASGSAANYFYPLIAFSLDPERGSAFVNRLPGELLGSLSLKLLR